MSRIEEAPKKFLRTVQKFENRNSNKTFNQEDTFKIAYANFRLGLDKSNLKKKKFLVKKSLALLDNEIENSFKEEFLKGICLMYLDSHDLAFPLFRNLQDQHPKLFLTTYYKAQSFYQKSNKGLVSIADSTNYFNLISELNLAILSCNDTATVWLLAESAQNITWLLYNYKRTSSNVFDNLVSKKLELFNVDIYPAGLYTVQYNNLKKIDNYEPKNSSSTLNENLFEIKFGYKDLNNDSSASKTLILKDFIESNSIRQLLDVPKTIDIIGFTLGVVKHVRCVKYFNSDLMTFDCHNSLNLESNSEFFTSEMKIILKELNHNDRRIYLEAIKIENGNREYLKPVVGNILIKE